MYKILLQKLTALKNTFFLYKKEMDLRVSPLMIVIGRLEMDM